MSCWTGADSISQRYVRAIHNFATEAPTLTKFQIVGPRAAVRQLFSELGIQAVQQHLAGCTSVLFGYYPCDSPPQVGFRIGGDDSPTFPISPAAFRQIARGSNNCTATITGIDFHSSSGPLWIVGQAWFQGKYIDFNVDNQRIGVASLKAADGCN